MPEASFAIQGYRLGSIRVESQKVRGEGGPLYPRLVIPFSLSFKPMKVTKDEQEQEIEYVQNYTVLYFWGSLSISSVKPEIKIADFQSEPLLHFSEEWDSDYTIYIPLDLPRIEYLEEIRKGDIGVQIRSRALIAKHPLVPVGQRERDKRIQELLTIHFDLPVEIPQSHWVDKVLPGLGYGKVKLIEVPIPEKIVPEIFQKALRELEEARRYFVEGEHDKVVAHCRGAVEQIPNTLTVDLSDIEKPSFNDKVEGFLKQHLSTVLADSKRNSLRTMIKATWTLSSIPHHPSPPGYFDRADAEAVMLLTTALLAYVGKLLKRREQK